ncbi:MAG: rRNA cytosine-C5-methylase [Verrucomicrobiales bacterium]|nr:rRNA cytosine-C5-methylase [Verrucomicrobiales bacterium]|tara:strand:+ start:4169 stop:5452 length:1284 start_codon:yes stop_codon:yes gene_type:complete
MKPSARMASSIELLERLDVLWGRGERVAADGVLQRYFRGRRFIGSKDRTEIARVVYGVLRHGATLEWWLKRAKRKASPRGLALGHAVFLDELGEAEVDVLFDGSKYGATPLASWERDWVGEHTGLNLLHADMPAAVRGEVPDWMLPALEEVLGDDLAAGLAGLNAEAQVDLRVNVLKTCRDLALENLRFEGLEAEVMERSEVGIRLMRRGPLRETHAFRKGWVEVQDEGSQLAAQLVKARAGERGVDFCAGAGGKTLALAAAMGNEGEILAWDVDRPRLTQMEGRLKRAGVTMVRMRKLKSRRDPFVAKHHGTADWVLVDAPCTGSGTWRRSPDLKWRTSADDLQIAVARQRAILAAATPCVKAGGRLVYVTCSVFKDENERQVDWVLKECPGFTVKWLDEEQAFLRLWPHLNGTDGFFGAVLRKDG